MILVLVIVTVVIGLLLYFGEPPNISEQGEDPLAQGDGDDGEGEADSDGETDDSLLDVPPELVAALLGLVFLVLLGRVARPLG